MAKEEKKEVKQKRPTALKRDDQAEKSRLRNRAYKSRVRSAVRVLRDLISAKDAEAIKTNLRDVYSLMDKGIKHGVYKKNTAARIKSRLAAQAAALSKAK